MFTYQYHQPDAYHFSLDSIHLAEFAAHHFVTDNPAEARVLDLCAGCGVVGFELSWYRRELIHFDFIEIQEIYTDYFRLNNQLVNRTELKIKWHLLNYEQLTTSDWKNKYDLIVSNPPYFLPNQGMLSPSEFKNRCRFYLDASFQSYIQAIENTLVTGGKAYFLLRNLTHHGTDLFKEAQSFVVNSQLSKIDNTRGTDIILLEKTR